MKKSTPKKTIKSVKKTAKKTIKKATKTVTKKVTPTPVVTSSSLSPFQILLWLSIIFSSILIIISKL